MLEDYKNFVSSAATIVTILQFFSGSEICSRVKKQGFTGDISGFPFVGGIFATSSWFTYGYLLNDNSIILTNVVGFCLQVTFLVIYLQYCVSSISIKTIRKQMVLLFSLSFCIIYFAFFTNVEDETIKFYVGLFCCSASILFCATPLISLKDVFRTKSTETLPFPLILTMFFMGGLWMLYGLIIKNSFVMIPNMIGCLLATFQLSLFVLYPNRSKESNNSGKVGLLERA